MKLLILDEAAAEAESARQYYTRQALPLGERFVADLGETLQRIELSPDSFPKLETLPDSEPYRRALFKIFRYAVVFEIQGDLVLVLAIAHTSRNPNYWLSRLH